MSNTSTQTTPWLTANDLARACGTTAEKIEALARSNHWPRMHGPSGAKFPLDVETVRRALAGRPNTVHGSIPLR